MVRESTSFFLRYVSQNGLELSVMHDPKMESGDDPALNAAIVEWFAAVEREGSPNPEEFIARHPGCAAGLREFFADYYGFQELANDVGAAGQSPAEQQTQLSPDSNSLGKRNFETYEVLHEIARGGMGIVFKASDRELKREIAVKVLLERHQGEATLVQRFVEEAQIAGQLQHPGITPVYALGEFPDQRPYFTMKLVKGETLSQLLAKRGNPQEDRQKFLKIFEQICHTLAYAHSRGVIHRDLKPSNIMVGAFAEVQVMDWGLAKVLAEGRQPHPLPKNVSVIRTARSDSPDALGDSSSQTRVGSVLGTLPYMPPEQALGEVDQIDKRSDVFGLGAILCEILTGRPPYVATTDAQLRRLAARAELTEAFENLDRCDADQELTRLARRTLAPEPADRPADAGILAQEMTAYREGVEKRLRQAELAEVQATTRAAEESVRRKLTLVFSGALLLVLAVGVIGTSVGLFRANRALQAEAELRIKAETSEQVASKATIAERDAKEDLRRELYVADLQLANQIWESENGTATQVAELLAAHIPSPGQTDLREFAWQLHWTELNLNSSVLKGHAGGARVAAFTSDGHLVTLDEDLMMRCWNLSNGKPFMESKLKKASQVSCWAISADSRRIALGSVDQIHVFDTETGKYLRIYTGQSLVLAMSLSPDGRHLAAAWGDGRIEKWDVDQDAQTPVNFAVPNPNRRLALDRIELTPDAEGLFLLDYPETSKVTRLTVGNNEEIWATQHDSAIYSIAFSPDGKWIATGDANGQFCLSNGTIRHTITGIHRGPVSAFGFSADGRLLATGGVDGMVTICDVEPGKSLRRMKGHQGRIHALSFSPNALAVASASADGTTRVWDIRSVRDRRSARSSRLLGSRELPVFSLTYSADGSRIAVGTGRKAASIGGGEGLIEGIVEVWNVQTGELESTFPAADGRVLALAWNDNRLITGGYDSYLQVWDLETMRSQKIRTDVQGDVDMSAIGTLAVAPNGTLVAAGFGRPTAHQSDYPQVVKIWEFANGNMKPIQTLMGHFNTICQVAFSPDGTLLATASDDRQVILWSTKDWKMVWQLKGTDRFKSVTFSVDGKTVIAGDSRGTVTIWETASGRRVSQLRGHAAAVYRIVFSADGRTLATASWDNTIKLWEPVKGRELRTLHDHDDWISCLAFAPDGTLATGSFDKTIRLWNAASLAEISKVQASDQELADILAARRDERLNKRKTLDSVTLSSVELKALSGTYDGRLTVSIETDHITIQPIEGHAGVPVKLYAKSARKFFARDCELDVTFLTDKDGNVTRVVIHNNGIAHEVRRKN